MRVSLPKTLRSFWMSSWFLALPVAVLFILLLPDIFNKYQSEILKSGNIDKPNGFEYYADLNGDATSERIILFDNTVGKASLKIIEDDGSIRDQFYFRGSIIPCSNSLRVGQFNEQGEMGIFFLSWSGDSILLHGINPYGKIKNIFLDLLVAMVTESHSKTDCIVPGITLADLDRDGTMEIVSGFLAGFPVIPRLVFVYNIRESRLMISPPAANYHGLLDTADLNEDGYPELIMSSYSIDNNQGRFNIPYDDNTAWLTVYDRNLNFHLPPVPFPGKYISLLPIPVHHNGQWSVVALYHAKVSGNGPPRLLKYNSQGVLLDSMIIDDTSRIRNYNLLSARDPGHFYLVRESGVIEEIDANLKVVKNHKVEGIAGPSFLRMDIDGDGIPETIFTHTVDSRYIITDDNFLHPVRVNIPFENFRSNLSVVRKKGEHGKLFMQLGGRYILVSYEINPWYYFRYPVYAGIYLVALGFIILVRYLQRRTLRQHYQAERKIAGMQLLQIGNQLDPHFTFNAINSISAAILQEKPEEANRNLISLSKLMRSAVLQSDSISRSLAEELDFLQNYLTLIQNRMNGSFIYSIDPVGDVNFAVQLPRMIIQNFVENAVKHGLKPLKVGGILRVGICQTDGMVTILVEDNGIGRKASAKAGENGTGKGIVIVDQLISIINKYNTRKISYKIYDLEDEQGNARGTRVELTVPEGVRYSFSG